ncbi:hypothetical protein [Buttiauxella sp.]|uniref:hypothetical protein n=1 Tax=Buttiauxella sp. TaxID=1972222 RepID=UPI003C7744A7
MHTENSNSQLTFQMLASPDFIASIAAQLVPAINTALDQLWKKLLRLQTPLPCRKKTSVLPMASVVLYWRSGLQMA